MSSGRKGPSRDVIASLQWASERDVLRAAENKQLEATDRDGRTGLHHAVLNGRVEIVRGAIRAGANVSPRDKLQWTPLHYAAQAHDPEMCRVLLADGAEVNAQDEHGNTPLSRAVFVSSGRPEVIRLLIRAKADPDIKNAHGVSARDLSKTIANFSIDLDRIERDL